MMASLLQAKETQAALMTSLEKSLDREMKEIRKLNTASIFMDSQEALVSFNWEMIWLELKRHAPTLLSIISVLLPSSEVEKHKPVVCFIAAMVLKHRYKHLSLVQRAVSILLYGNGTSKQVNVVYI